MTTFARLLSGASIVGALSFLVASCGSSHGDSGALGAPADDDAGQNEASDAGGWSKTQVVDQSGGIIEGPAVQLEIPAGALDGPQTITMRSDPKEKAAIETTYGVTIVTSVVNLEPTGLVFNSPISIKFLGQKLQDPGTVLWSNPTSPGAFDALPLQSNDDTGFAALGIHFSTVAGAIVDGINDGVNGTIQGVVDVTAKLCNLTGLGQKGHGCCAGYCAAGLECAPIQPSSLLPKNVCDNPCGRVDNYCCSPDEQEWFNKSRCDAGLSCDLQSGRCESDSSGCWETKFQGSGNWYDGSDNVHCGSDGKECLRCTLGHCQAGQCTCDSGCKDKNGACFQGNSVLACGKPGGSCSECPTGAVCDGNRDCTCTSGCTSLSDGELTCLSGTNADSCGSGGAACKVCDEKTPNKCLSDGSAFFDYPAKGLCTAGKCVYAPTIVPCGAGQKCDPGTASCVPCDATSCPNGCCDASGACVPGTSTPACGTAGAACQACKAPPAVCVDQQTLKSYPSQTTCDAGQCNTPPSLQTCIAGQSCIDAVGNVAAHCGCGPASCPNGCCDTNGRCLAGDLLYSCGTNGAACNSCPSPLLCGGAGQKGVCGGCRQATVCFGGPGSGSAPSGKSYPLVTITIDGTAYPRDTGTFWNWAPYTSPATASATDPAICGTHQMTIQMDYGAAGPDNTIGFPVTITNNGDYYGMVIVEWFDASHKPVSAVRFDAPGSFNYTLVVR